MKSHSHIRFLTAFIFCILLSCRHYADAAAMPWVDPQDALNASCAVIMKSTDKKNVFCITEVLLKDKQYPVKNGDTITLPHFTLRRGQQIGSDVTKPITSQTRILLYLQRDPKDLADWKITQSGLAFFWVNGPHLTGILQHIAHQAIDIRSQWIAALNTSRPKQRVKALWSFLKSYHGRFDWGTQAQLRKIGTPAGDYIASHFETLGNDNRDMFMYDLAKYKSERLHLAVLQYMKKRQQDYEDFLIQHKITDKMYFDHWDKLPEKVKDISSDISYGLNGLAGNRDRHDLPYIHGLALWAVKHRFIYTCKAAFYAFRMMPDKANLPIISTIWKEFSTHQNPDRKIAPWDMFEVLQDYKFPETVPLLTQFLTSKDRDDASQAETSLREIVGKDLGKSPKPWLDWYKKQEAK